jgi:hypothetical protein
MENLGQTLRLFNFNAISILKKLILMYGKLATTCFKYQVHLHGSEAIIYLNAFL